jgi:orotate phosphoribosyltransferase
MPDVTTQLEELRVLLQERSIRHGQFTLASGRKSRYYCDTKATTLSPDGARLVGEILYRRAHEAGAEAVGGLALGSTFIAAAVAMASSIHGHPIYGFTVRDEKKGHGLMRQTEESYHPGGDPLLSPGRRVAVVDDVVTGGGSIMKAIEVVREKGCEIVAVIPVVDRQEGGGDRLRGEDLPYMPLFEADPDGNLTIYRPPESREHHFVAAAGAASA